MSSSSTSLCERLCAVTPTINKICSITGAVGMSFAVLQNGARVYEHHYGYADLQTQATPNADTTYLLASVSKITAAAGFAKLVEDGKINWDTPIHQFVPEFTDERTITRLPELRTTANVTDLLGQRLGVTAAQGYWTQQEHQLLIDKSQTATVVGLLKPVVDFRKGMHYGNWGYALAGEILETVSGQNVENYLQGTLFKPLGLKDTTFAAPDEKRRVSSYISLSDGMPHPVPPPPLHAGKVLAGAGAVKSTLNDLLKLYDHWLKAATTPDEDGKKSPIRKAQDLWTPRTSISEGTDYAFGWVLTELPGQVGRIGTNAFECPSGLPTIAKGVKGHPRVIYHNGSMSGALSAVYILPDSQTVYVALCNTLTLGDASDWVAQYLTEIILDCPEPTDFIALATETAQNAATRHSKVQKQLDEERTPDTKHRPLQEYCGRYYNIAGNFYFDVEVYGDNGLRVITQGFPNVHYELYRYHFDDFAWDCDRDAEVRRTMWPHASVAYHKFCFSANENGRIDRFRWGFSGTASNGEEFYKHCLRAFGNSHFVGE